MGLRGFPVGSSTQSPCSQRQAAQHSWFLEAFLLRSSFPWETTKLWLCRIPSLEEERTARFIINPLGAKDQLCAACSGDPTAFLFWPCRCSECQESLTNWYYEKDGKLYCHKDYWAKFGEFCHGCSLLVTGPAMVSCPSAPHRPPLTLSRSPWSVIIWYFHQEDDVLYQFIQP